MAASSVSAWHPARQFPHTYPGDCPRQSYLLLDDQVHLLDWEHPEDMAGACFRDARGRPVALDQTLAARNLPPLKARFAVLAYGANRNPASLAIKFQNYHYQSPGRGLAVPVIKGVLRKADVVACNVTGQGYLYADVLYDTEDTAATEVEAWLNLLDEDQLRAINDSEAVRTGMYALGTFPGFRIEGVRQSLAPLGYAGNSRIFISPEFGKPLSFSTIAARNRIFPAMEPDAMLDHLLDVFSLREPVAQITGLSPDNHLSRELGKYLNGQWWYGFNTGDEPIRGYRQVLDMLRASIGRSSREVSTAARLKKQGMILPENRWYAPGRAYTLQGRLDAG